jgi:hypothetical protein
MDAASSNPESAGLTKLPIEAASRPFDQHISGKREFLEILRLHAAPYQVWRQKPAKGNCQVDFGIG